MLAMSRILVAAPAPTQVPEPLLKQVQRLSELLRDRYARFYSDPDGTMVQIVKIREGDMLALVVFSIGGFGGGNNHTQYFAVFSPDTDENGTQDFSHFSLVDVLPIAGKGWRSIERLNAKITRNSRNGDILLELDGLEGTEDDAQNFPSRKIKIHVLLKDGRLFEKKFSQ